MKPGRILRSATPGDGDAVAALFTASFALLEFLPSLHTAEEIRKFFGAVVKRERVSIVEEDGAVLGFIGETQNRVSHLYVHPGHLRRGIGSDLMNAAQSHQDHLRLRCFQKNEQGRAFYEAHGFEAAEFTDGSNNEENEPDILYEWRRLDPQRL